MNSNVWKKHIIKKICQDTSLPPSVVSYVLDSLKDAVIDELLLKGRASLGWVMFKVHKDGKPRAHLKIDKEYQEMLKIYERDIL